MNKVSKKTRLYFNLAKKDLKWLAERAQKENEDFFIRNPRLKNSYCKSLIGIVLCQGAALHYIDKKNGINDFDIWLFYKESKKNKLIARRPFTDKKGYMGAKIDFMRRSIPAILCKKFINKPDRCILIYLRECNTDTKRFLLQKAGVGLYPKKVFSEVIWRGNND
jgi:hypothetical protein